MTKEFDDSLAASPKSPLGALDRIDVEELHRAFALAQAGTIYDLGSELSAKTPQGSRETFGRYQLTQYRVPRCLTNPEFIGHDFSMDLITGSPHLGSHIDAFTHVQRKGKIYGDVPVTEAFGDFGWKQYGVETIPPIVGRGVLLDIAHSEGYGQLPDDFDIGLEHIKKTIDLEGVEIRKGDIVLIRTGKYKEYRDGSESYFSPQQPGIGLEAALWLFDQGMAVLGSDTSGTEPRPLRDPAHTVHSAMLYDRGVHLLEILNLESVSERGVYEFLFICLPMKFVGATGSWVRPIAIV